MTTETTEAGNPGKVRRRVRKEPVTTSGKIAAAIKQTNKAFKERSDAITVSWIAKLTGLNSIDVGDPGTAKTALEKAILMHITGCKTFKIQLHSFSTPNDIVGRYDLAALQQGREERRREGKLLEADFGMFDEVLKAGEGCSNSVLGILNEREFEGEKLRLLSIAAATNWPEVDRMTKMTVAFWDRFHLRCIVSSIRDKKARIALQKDGGKSVRDYAPADGTTVTLDELKEAQKEIREIGMADPIHEILLNAVDRLRREEIEVSDRRVLQVIHAAQAVAWLDGRTDVGPSDLSTIIGWMGWNTRAEVQKAASVADTIDVEAARELILDINKTYDRYKRDRHNLTPETAAEMMNSLIEAKERSNARKAACKFVKKTLTDVEVAEEKLRNAWEELSSRFENVLED
jgi:MoxR-like ATPase